MQSQDVDVFENAKTNQKIKTKKNEKIFCTEPYALEFYNAISGQATSPTTTVGKIVNAKLVGHTPNEILFDMGGKDFIRIPNTLKESNYIANLAIGASTDVMITGTTETPFHIKGSIASIYEVASLGSLKSLNEGDVVSVHIKELTPAGYNLDILAIDNVTIPGFMPNTLAGVNKLHKPEAIVGKTLDVMIETFSEEKGTYIVSRRKYLQTLIPTEIKKLDTTTVYTGEVTGTTPFGVFVEFNGCLTGMVHKTNIRQDLQDKLHTIPAGTQIDFYIKEVLENKIILTQIQRESLWDTIQVNEKYEGIVKDVKSFGTLVSIDNETVGLLNTAEVAKLGKPLVKGDSVSVRIVDINRMGRKIILSLAKK